MAGLNEVVRFISSDGWWVTYDTWISTALTLLFTFAQYPLIVRHEKPS
jgi:intracellular septation protein A